MVAITFLTNALVVASVAAYIAVKEMPVAARIVARKAVSEKPVTCLKRSRAEPLGGWLFSVEADNIEEEEEENRSIFDFVRELTTL